MDLPSPRYYALIEGKVVPITNLMQWAKWYETAHKTDGLRVAKDTVNGVFVSTVFLSLDHGFKPWDGPEPVLFETMVFPEAYDPNDSSTYAGERMYRYHTLEQAKAGHAAVVALLEVEQVARGALSREVIEKVRLKVFGGGA